MFALSLTFQTILLVCILHNGLSHSYLSFVIVVVVHANLCGIIMHKLLQIKKLDQYREWTRKDSFIIAEGDQNDVLSNEDNMFRSNKKITSFKLRE